MSLKNLLLLLVLLIETQVVFTQTNLWAIPHNNIIINNRGCFINSKGEVVLCKPYDHISDFHEGYANFQDSISSGYLDSCGNSVINILGYCYDFSEGYAFCNYGDSLFFINKKGKVSITPKYKNYIFDLNIYDGIPHFSEGLSSMMIRKVKDGEWYNYIFIDTNGKKAIYKNFLFASNFSEGLAFVVLTNGEHGYINKKGELIFKLRKKERGFDFSEGFAVVLDEYGKSYYIDKNGKKLGDKIFTHAYPFSNGLARVEIEEKKGFINKKGEIVINPIYNSFSTYDFSEGVASVSKEDSSGNGFITYLIDTNGVVVSKPFHNSIIRKFKNGLAYGTQPIENSNCTIHFYLNKKNEVVWRDTICTPPR